MSVSLSCRRALAWSLLVGVFAWAAFSSPSPAAEVGPLCIDVAGEEGSADDKVYHYEVELAVTPNERRRGLMYRRELAPRTGMLFGFGRDQIITMWMKNTLISLDMVFTDERGVVRHIARNTTPRSLDSITSRVPTRSVLEINAGEAKEIGLAPGDRLRHPLFGTSCEPPS